MSMFSDFDYVHHLTLTWVQEERERRQVKSQPLLYVWVARFAPYLSDEILQTIRVATAEEIQIPAGMKAILPLSRRCNPTAVSLVDTVVVVGDTLEAMDMGLLFHECVHVCQQNLLGLEKFTMLYFEDFMQRKEYRKIRAEAQAHGLQERFERGEVFDVEAEVRVFFREELNG